MIPLGLKGLNTDIPSHALSMDFFTGGENIRSHNGALRGVNRFVEETNIDFLGDVGGATPTIYAACQFTPAGSTYYNIFALCQVGSDWKLRGYSNQNGGEVREVDVTNVEGSIEFDTTLEHKPSMFVFNECLVLNTGKSVPSYLPSQGAHLRDFNKDDVAANPGVLDAPLGWIDNTPSGEAIYCSKLRPFGGRLVALSLFGANGTYNERSTVVFSSPILTLGSLKSLQWNINTENSAADDIITETPGAVIDGGQLGSNFIVYKSDCVLTYTEVNGAPFVAGRVIQTDDGILSANCWADIGNNQHIVLGNNGVYIHNGENQKQNVSKNKIQDDLYNTIKNKNNCFVFRHERDKETWFGVRNTNNTMGANQFYCYAEETDSWYKRTSAIAVQNNTYNGQYRTRNVFATEIEGDYRVFGVNSVTDRLLELQKNSIIGHGETIGKESNNRTLNAFAEFENNAIEDSSQTKSVTAAYPTCDAKIKAGIISTDKLGTAATITTKEYDPSSDYKIDFRETGRYFDFKIEIPAAALTTTLAEDLDNSETEVDVASDNNFFPGDIITVDSEKMSISSISSNTLTVVRGIDSTSAATHSNGATVTCSSTRATTNDPSITGMSFEIKPRGAR